MRNEEGGREMRLKKLVLLLAVVSILAFASGYAIPCYA